MTERRKNQSEEWTYFTLLFIYFITVNKYRFCISVIGYINEQIISIGKKKKSISVDHYLLWQSGASESATVCVISLSICYWLFKWGVLHECVYEWVSEWVSERERARVRVTAQHCVCVCVRACGVRPITFTMHCVRCPIRADYACRKRIIWEDLQ